MGDLLLPGLCTFCLRNEHLCKTQRRVLRVVVGLPGPLRGGRCDPLASGLPQIVSFQLFGYTTAADKLPLLNMAGVIAAHFGHFCGWHCA